MVNGYAGWFGFSGTSSLYVGNYIRGLDLDAWGHQWAGGQFPGSPFIPGGSQYKPKSNPSYIIDWAGAALAKRWMTGWGNRWDIDNDSSWNKYMKNHKGLATTLSIKLWKHATEVANKKAKGEIDINFSFEFEGGENITGYDFLGGTNGGFDVWGSYETEKTKLGCRTVKYNLNFVWNDIIDPNLKYDTDIWKAPVVSELTNAFIGKQAYDYNISIQYSAKSEITVDNNKKILKSSGYPFNNSYPLDKKFDAQKNPSIVPSIMKLFGIVYSGAN